MVRFNCKRCRYNFELHVDRIPKFCPYCGTENSVEKEKSAEEILDLVGENS